MVGEAVETSRCRARVGRGGRSQVSGTGQMTSQLVHRPPGALERIRQQLVHTSPLDAV